MAAPIGLGDEFHVATTVATAKWVPWLDQDNTSLRMSRMTGPGLPGFMVSLELPYESSAPSSPAKPPVPGFHGFQNLINGID
jgi:hypothetical protein